MMILEICLKGTLAACFIGINNLAERVHQKLLQQQQYYLTKPLIKKHLNPIHTPARFLLLFTFANPKSQLDFPYPRLSSFSICKANSSMFYKSTIPRMEMVF